MEYIYISSDSETEPDSQKNLELQLLQKKKLSPPLSPEPTPFPSPDLSSGGVSPLFITKKKKTIKKKTKIPLTLPPTPPPQNEVPFSPFPDFDDFFDPSPYMNYVPGASIPRNHIVTISPEHPVLAVEFDPKWSVIRYAPPPPKQKLSENKKKKIIKKKKLSEPEFRFEFPKLQEKKKKRKIRKNTEEESKAFRKHMAAAYDEFHKAQKGMELDFLKFFKAD